MYEVTLAERPIAWFVHFTEAMQYKRTWKSSALGAIHIKEIESTNTETHNGGN